MRDEGQEGTGEASEREYLKLLAGGASRQSPSRARKEHPQASRSGSSPLPGRAVGAKRPQRVTSGTRSKAQGNDSAVVFPPTSTSSLIPHPLSLFEREAFAAGARYVAGVDEAGRGPLAGPVVAAAVILPPEFDPEGVTDSKKLSAAARETALERICAEALSVGVGIVEPEEIDRLNILRATHRAMRLAVAQLSPCPDVVFVDGLPVPDLHSDCRSLVRGDSRCLSVAAASIVAKVTRDRLMAQCHEQYPEYEFARHKGYPTPEHLEALAKHGPCPLHRRSFGPVAQCVLRFEEKDDENGRVA